MKKLLLSFMILFYISFLFAIPHTVYIEVRTQEHEHPNQVSYIAWIVGREDDVLTESSPYCGYYNDGVYDGTAYVQVGYFMTQYQAGDILHVFAVTDLGISEGDFVLTDENSQMFGEMYGTWSEGTGLIIDSNIEPLNIDFTAEPLSGNAPLEVHFTNNSNQTANHFYWDFENDGHIDSQEVNPVYIYYSQGIYNVKLYIYNENSGNVLVKENYITVTAGATTQENQIATTKYMLKNYPNPFNPQTTIEFYLPQKSDASLQIYNIKGQKVRDLPVANVKSGLNSVVWNGKDNNGNIVGSGIYYYHLVVKGETKEMGKCVLLK